MEPSSRVDFLLRPSNGMFSALVILIGIWDRNKKKRGWARVAQTL
jgi:hypothetical protein